MPAVVIINDSHEADKQQLSWYSSLEWAKEQPERWTFHVSAAGVMTNGRISQSMLQLASAWLADLAAGRSCWDKATYVWVGLSLVNRAGYDRAHQPVPIETETEAVQETAAALERVTQLRDDLITCQPEHRITCHTAAQMIGDVLQGKPVFHGAPVDLTKRQHTNDPCAAEPNPGPHLPQWEYDAGHDIYRCSFAGCTFGHIGGVSREYASRLHEEYYGPKPAPKSPHWYEQNRNLPKDRTELRTNHERWDPDYVHHNHD